MNKETDALTRLTRKQRVARLTLLVQLIVWLPPMTVATTGGEAQIVITSPQPNQKVSGEIGFSVDVRTIPGLHSIEYLLNGKPLYNGEEPVKPLTAPYIYRWRTQNVWDGSGTLQAIARDEDGNILVQSKVPFQIANGTTTVALLSPDPNKTLSGKVDWTLETDYRLEPGENYVWYRFVDGKQHDLTFSPSKRQTVSLDTAQWPNGRHELFCAHYVETTRGTRSVGMSRVMFNVDNGRTPMELRSTFREMFLIPGETVKLIPRLAYTNGEIEQTAAGFAIADAAIAGVNGSGVVTAISPGVTKVTLAAGSKTTTTYVHVLGAREFPHFGKNGKVLTRYDPSQSILLRTLFSADAGQLTRKPALGLEFQKAAINALTSGFYYNAASNGANEKWENWKPGMDQLLNNLSQTAARYRLGIFLTGDDIARTNGELYDSITNGELYDSITNDSAARKIQYVVKWAKRTGRVVAIDMVDEVDILWGDRPRPNDDRWQRLPKPIPADAFMKLMSIMNGIPGRPPIGWPVSGLAPAATAANWQGDPAYSDFATFFWTFVVNAWRRAYPESASTPQIISNMEKVYYDRIPVLQRQRPMLFLTSISGPAYTKRGPGSRYEPGQDVLRDQGTRPDQVAAAIMYAAARGMAGVRAYAFDSESQKSGRQKVQAENNYLQTGSDPFEAGVDRWRAMSAAFNLTKTLEEHLLQPQTHAIDLGGDFITGARAGQSDKLLIALNALEVPQTALVDLSPYNDRAAMVQRYRLRADKLTTETIANRDTDNVTFEPSETIVWLFKAGGA